uniref:Putative 28 kDa metastriate family member n=1 Tax=Rhipicephalus pulchellus TaxID=72859 RepID=L7M9S8_RHIPC
MLRKYLFFLCIFLRQYCTGKELDYLEKIGEGVTANIYIFHNSSYLATPDAGSTSEENGESETTKEIPELFKKLFKEVQDHFEKMNISIVFNVKNASAYDSIEVPYRDWQSALNAPATLQKLIELRPNKTQPKCDNIAFYYTNKTLWEDYGRRGDGIPRRVPYLSTWKTFCSTQPSAAVLKLDPNSVTNTSTIHAVRRILGFSYNPMRIHPVEKKLLNETLLQCPTAKQAR